ncbi:MAG: hypothetical protein AAF662_10930 [Pseudomonadota bacterium]
MKDDPLPGVLQFAPYSLAREACQRQKVHPAAEAFILSQQRDQFLLTGG